MTTVIAIDGPAASGKSSTAAAVARALGFLHVDSGALYRGMTRVSLDLGAAPSPAEVLASAERRGLGLEVRGGAAEVVLDGQPAADAIRSPEVTAGVSEVSAVPAIREWVNRRLRRLAQAGQAVVLDGRDIGTVVFPDANLKVFLVAAPVVRARRRLLQRGAPFGAAEVATETARIAARDQADSSRPVAPLQAAPDAIAVDTTDLSFEEQVARIVALAQGRGLKAG